MRILSAFASLILIVISILVELCVWGIFCAQLFEINYCHPFPIAELKLVVELFKKTKTESLPLLGHDKVDQKVQEKPRNVMSTVQPQQNNMYSKPSENRYQPSMGCDKIQGEDKQNSGTYVVGGSAFGWNFITFPGKESVYYGVTKESFRAANK